MKILGKDFGKKGKKRGGKNQKVRQYPKGIQPIAVVKLTKGAHDSMIERQRAISQKQQEVQALSAAMNAAALAMIQQSGKIKGKTANEIVYDPDVQNGIFYVFDRDQVNAFNEREQAKQMAQRAEMTSEETAPTRMN